MTQTDLEAGRAALLRRNWEEAYQLLTSDKVRASLTAGDLENLGEAAFWTSRLRDAIRFRERAFSAYSGEGDAVSAARVGLQVAWNYVLIGIHAVSGGWFAKAERLLRDRDECSEHGELANSLAHLDIARGDLESALSRAREAFAIGERLGDADLQAAALNTQGAVLIRLGEVVEGMAAIDESMTSAVAGQLAPFTTASIYCTTISACQRVGDLRRASEWTDAAEHCSETSGMQDFPGDCRAHRVGILRVNGKWDDLDAAAQAAISAEGAERSHVAKVYQELGEVHLFRGNYDAAAHAFEQAEELGMNPQPGRALLSLALGDIEAAGSFINTALNEQTWDRFARARLLPAKAEICLAAGNVDDAQDAVEELGDIADVYQTNTLEASRCYAEGQILRERGEHLAAVAPLRAAMHRWLDLPAPFEAACSRFALAQALRDAGSMADAITESRSARNAFERLKAAPYAERASALLDELQTSRRLSSDTAKRVTRTFVFTDIVGSTDLLATIGDDAWRDLSKWHDQTLRARFAAHGGEEIDHAGDGFFVAFSSVDAAIDCAIDIQRDLAIHRKDHGFSPSVRIGIHIAEAHSDADGYSGQGVHQAARIGGAAEGNQILASKKTVDAAADKYDVKNGRALVLKGIKTPVDVVTVVW